MSDENGQNAAEVTGAEPSAAPSQPAPVQGPSQEDYTRLQQRVAGMQGFYEKAREAGFDSPDKFASASQRLKQIEEFESSFGAPLERLLSVRQPSAQPGADAGDFDFSAFKDELLGEAESRAEKKVRMTMAEQEYQAALAKHNDVLGGVLTDDVADEMLKDAPPSFLRKLLNNSLEIEAHRHREQFGEDHPLKGRFAPIDGSVASKSLEALREERKRIIGEQMAAKAKEVSRPRPSGTPAGSGSGQGSPTTNQRPMTQKELARDIATRAVRQASGS